MGFPPIPNFPATSAQSLYGLFSGAPGPIKQASRYFWPHQCFPVRTTALTTTAGRYYIIPFYLDRAKTFVGAWCFNSGAGDNGETIKIAIYNESTSGGPGTLAKNFGEVTLTAASAVRNFASSWSATPGMYYLELVANSALALYSMGTMDMQTDVGQILPSAANVMGVTTPLAVSAVDYQIPVGEFVAGTYANFPEATSLTPTTTIMNDDGGTFPFMGLYT